MNKINKKLLEIQKEVGAIKKKETNPFFNSKYFDINGLIEIVKPVLTKHDVILTQPIEVKEDKEYVVTRLTDAESGESIDSSLKLPDITDPQKLGSAITYYRRYTLQSLLALQAEDDDGQNASQATSEPKYDTWKDGMGMQDEERMCAQCGGIMTYKEGKTKAGKPYRAFFCSQDRTHSPIWL